MASPPVDFESSGNRSGQKPAPFSKPCMPRLATLIRPRFSVRTFLLLTTLLTVAMAIVIRLERPGQLRIWIHRNGGECVLSSKPAPGKIESWLRWYLPREYFDGVIQAKLRTAKNNEIVDKLDAFPQLQWLRMDNSKFDNNHLRSIRKMGRLEVLFLHNTSLNDTGMAHIGRLSSLRELRIDDTSISDSSIAHLVQLPNLEVLYLNDNQLSDAAAEKLECLKKLKCLHLENSGISSSAIHALRRSLPNCLILGP